MNSIINISNSNFTLSKDNIYSYYKPFNIDCFIILS